MNLPTYVQQLYAADKAALEMDYENLMKQEESQHRERMDAYAEMRNAGIARLEEKYGLNESASSGGLPNNDK